MTRLTNPIPIWIDATGLLLDGGFIYIGVANADPAVQPLSLFWDEAMTVPAMQPLRTMGGRIVNGAQPANIFFAAGDFSTRVTDAFGSLIDYQPTTYINTTTYQPLDSDLTAIASQGTADYGRSLLLLGSQAALQQAAGTAGALQTTGGTMTGNISRQGAGAYVYSDAGLSPRIRAPQPSGSANPSGLQPGDLFGFY